MTLQKHFSALAAATVTATLALTGCSASKSPETVAVNFIAAFMGDNGTLPSTLVCEGIPNSEADSKRFTTDLASNIRAGRTGEVNADGYVVVEVLYSRSGNDQMTDVQVNTRNLCVSALDPDSGSPSENDPAPESKEHPLGSYENPVAATDGGVVRFDELAVLEESMPYLMLPRNAVVTIIGDGIEASPDSEVSFTATDAGIELDASDSHTVGYLVLSAILDGTRQELTIQVDAPM